MEKAKQAVSSFLSHDGKHKTTVDEDVRGHVTEEHVRPHQHENVTTALDKEVHQEHHHTTIQPISHKETLAEQHHHNVVPVQHKEFHHGKDQETRDTLDREAARFKDTSTTHTATQSSTTAPVVSGERIHHHVHEHVQPIIQKETVQPHVVHTTVPIHETHHAAPVHHGTSTLPPKTLQEFTGERGGLGEKASQKLTEFEGCPKPYRKELQSEQREGDKSMHLHHQGDNYGENLTQGREGAGIGQGREGVLGGVAAGAAGAGATRKSRRGLGNRDRSGSSSSISSSDEESRRLGKSGKSHKSRGLGGAAAGGMASHNTENTNLQSNRGLEHRGMGTNTGGGQSNMNPLSSNRGVGSANTAGLNAPHGSQYDNVKSGGLSNDPMNNRAHDRDSGVDMRGNSTGQAATEKKPSLMDRLNPLKDADGDGKKGLMD
ncbi:hypothetical protein FZEAL_5988 [Fusarium zealandicum]|uniref:Allergen n=1 Tax=Fusarium zealandicum TaxID=1053134 RepID=A0A8H4UJL8_9HYPO|nr:hypothetical protein FZEAL_5988 [Fusarium zealandicum]